MLPPVSKAIPVSTKGRGEPTLRWRLLGNTSPSLANTATKRRSGRNQTCESHFCGGDQIGVLMDTTLLYILTDNWNSQNSREFDVSKLSRLFQFCNQIESTRTEFSTSRYQRQNMMDFMCPKCVILPLITGTKCINNVHYPLENL